MSKHNFETPDACEAAFYEAFERADLKGVMACWAEQEELVCIHPQGPRLTGHAAVRESFLQIFSNGLSLRVELVQGMQFQSEVIAVHCVLERVTMKDEKRTPPPISATNVFARTDEGWRMIAHHASPTASTEAIAASQHTLH